MMNEKETQSFENLEFDFHQTVDTYNNSAAALAEKFKGIGPRIEDIERAFELAGNPPEPTVLEIGCGDGRDAKEIIIRSGWYLGFDISKSMVKLAEHSVPEATFEVGDAVSYPYPPDLDAIFAFASLLHIPKEDVAIVLAKAAQSLREDGIFYISLKDALEYNTAMQEDEFGLRRFYYYSPDMIEELAGSDFEKVYTRQHRIGSTNWFEIALKRKHK